jgi:hypothetical protein
MRALALSLLLLSASFAGLREAKALDCSTIASRICTLDPNYDGPIPSSGTYKPPSGSSCQNPDPITPSDKMFIISAINQAKGQLQKDLCSLTQIVIMRNSSQPSWGFWEDPQYHGGAQPGGIYIAINSNDLNKTFSAKQDANNKPDSQLLNAAIGSHQESGLPGNIVPETFGLLYVLAHEFGHIKWHQSLSSVPCKNAILNHPWSDITTNQPRWTQFGPNDDFGARDNSQVPWPKDVQNSNDLLKIYYGGFSTALASANPEEDFVESYAIRGVSKACNNCVFQYVVDQNNTVKLNDNRGSSNLGGKFTCANNLTSFLQRTRRHRRY